MSVLLRFLGRLAQMRLSCRILSGRWDRGALGICEELRMQWDGGVGHTVWNLWMIPTHVVLKRTTPVAVGKDHLQGLLVVLLHGLLVLTSLGLKGENLILCCLNLQQERRLLNLQTGDLRFALHLAFSTASRVPWARSRSSSASAFLSPVRLGSSWAT